MAEYIDREKINLFGFYDAGDYTQAMRCIKSLSTVGVVERKKVDEAIEELRKEIEENHLNVIDYADGEWIVKDFIYGAIDRLKDKLKE